MTTTDETVHVPAWPTYALTVRPDGRVIASGPTMDTSGHPTRAAAIEAVAASAAGLGRPVRATATEADGTIWHLVVSPDGTVAELATGRRGAKAAKKRRTKRRTRSEKTLAEPASALTPLTPAASGGTPGGQPQPDGFASSLDRITEHLRAGRTDLAAQLALRLDEQAAGVLGMSHPDALHIREVRARAAALSGDLTTSVWLYRDIAERWHYQGDGARAEAAASRAVKVWKQITDVESALTTGLSVIRMRNQIPGEPEALADVLKHWTHLEETRATGHPLHRATPTPAPTPAAPTPTPTPRTTRRRRAMPTWERSAPVPEHA